MVNKCIVTSIIFFYSFISANYVFYPPYDPENLYRHYYQPAYNYNQLQVPERVRVDIFYESLCPDCIKEYPSLPTLADILGNSVEIYTYPFGNAKMREENGNIVVKCQHGEAECYGNKLHACAIAVLQATRSWLPYNACLMARNSDDAAADTCGQAQNIDSESIKTCAKGWSGQQLLIHYRNLSLPYHYSGVPYVLINGQPKPDDEPLITAVCKAFKVAPPDACRTFHNM